jgi:signal peptidase
VRTYHYPAVLPYGVVSVLHAFHPLAAALASIVTIVTPMYVIHWLLVDGRAPLEGRSRSRNPWWQFR